MFIKSTFSLIDDLGDRQFIDFFDSVFEKYDIDPHSVSNASKEYSRNKYFKSFLVENKLSEIKEIKEITKRNKEGNEVQNKSLKDKDSNIKTKY